MAGVKGVNRFTLVNVKYHSIINHPRIGTAIYLEEYGKTTNLPSLLKSVFPI